MIADPEFGIKLLFLSTLPARGATPSRRALRTGATYFYPRSPRGERQGACKFRVFGKSISIHAPREGSDAVGRIKFDPPLISIHAPREGSDILRPFYPGGDYISIHAPREGSDP